MNAHGWWWHLFNDPVRSNWWSVIALGVILILGGVALVVLSYLDVPDLIHRTIGCRYCRRIRPRDKP